MSLVIFNISNKLGALCGNQVTLYNNHIILFSYLITTQVINYFKILENYCEI